MFKLSSTLLVALALTACQPDLVTPEEVVDLTPKEIVVTPTGWASSFHSLVNQRYGGDLWVPKYSMAAGTYTNKHRDVAFVSPDGSLYSSFSDNTIDNNQYVYVTKEDQRTLVHTSYNWSDPHTNATILMTPEGYIRVHVASRGIPIKKQNGAVYQSTLPNNIDNFECVAGECNDSELWNESYPQPHVTAWGYQTLYTEYLEATPDELNCCNWYRSQWSNTNGKRVQLSEGAHYQISYYSEHTKTLYTAYNYHVLNHPDTRVNLSVMKTTDGINWTTIDDFILQLPVERDGGATIVYPTEDKQTFVYLKDLTVDATGKLRVLFTESGSKDPTAEVTRELKEWVEDKGVTTLTETGHNYNSGAYFKDGYQIYVAAGTFGQPYYSGGDINLYKLTSTGYELESTLADGTNWSYIRAAKNGGMRGVVSSGSSLDYNLGSYHNYVEIK